MVCISICLGVKRHFPIVGDLLFWHYFICVFVFLLSLMLDERCRRQPWPSRAHVKKLKYTVCTGVDDCTQATPSSHLTYWKNLFPKLSVFTEFSLLKRKMFLSWNSHNNTGRSRTPGLQFAAVAIATEAKVKDRKSVSSFRHHNRNIFNLCMSWIIFCSSNWLATCDKVVWVQLICPGCHSNPSNYLLTDNTLESIAHVCSKYRASYLFWQKHFSGIDRILNEI